MKNLILILTLFIFLHAEGLNLELKGLPCQGSIIIGHIEPEETTVYYDGRKLNVIEGDFLLGLAKDADLQQNLRLISESGVEIPVLFFINEKHYHSEVINNIQRKYTDPPKNELLIRRLAIEKKIYKYYRDFQFEKQMDYDMIFQRPIEGGRISSPFGIRRIINQREMAPHSGLDIAVPLGTPVSACSDGLVLVVDKYFYQGKFVMLDHCYGLKSVYMHLDSIAVKTGEIVKIGDLLGNVGTTGRSSGPHLHWGIYWYSDELDPESLEYTNKLFFTFKSGR